MKFLGVVCLALLWPGSLGIGQIVVTSTSDSGPGSLRQAVSDVMDGGVIEFAAAIRGSVIVLDSGPLTVVGKSITMRAPAGGSAMTMFISAIPAGTQRILEIAPTAAVTIEHLYFSNGYHPLEGGCIRNQGTLTMRDSCVLFGRSSHGAGISNTGSLVMTGCYLVSNTALAGRGGAIWSNGPVSLESCFLSANTAGDGGGAIWTSGTLTMAHCEVSSNAAGRSGGGIELAAGIDHEIESSMISFNRARQGGGIRSSAPVEMISTSVVGNVALDHGGGLLSDAGFQFLRQCTIANNKALVRAGGIDIRGNLAELRHCTVTANSAPDSPGIDVLTLGKVNVWSSIVAGHDGDDVATSDASGAYTSNGHNLIGSGATSFFTAPGDQTGVADPGLAPLGNYGGPSYVVNPIARNGYNGGRLLTTPPLPGGPAIDRGPTSGLMPSADQLGEARVLDGDGDSVAVIDVGAVEAISLPAFQFVVTSPFDAGPGTLRQAILDAPPGSFSHITFAAFLSGATISIGLGEMLVVDRYLLIDAGQLAAPVTIDADMTSRHFTVGSDASLNLRHLILRDGDPDDPLEFFEPLDGGSIRSFGALALDRCTVLKCVGRNPDEAGGGIVHLGSNLLLSDCKIENNSTITGTGGGIACRNCGPVSIDRTVIARNSGDSGGAIAGSAEAALILCDSHLDANLALCGEGGALRLGSSSTTVISTTFSGNSAASSGGAIWVGAFRPALYHQCTFSGNSAVINGGAIYAEGYFFAFPQRVAELQHCTVTDNSAPSGAGIYIADGGATPTVELYATIVSGNSPGDLDHGPAAAFQSAGFNLVGIGGGGAAVFSATGDQSGLASPGLLPLSDNGGPTPTHALIPSSPALDAGPVTPLAASFFPDGDQRHFPRQIDADGDGTSQLDVGAYEASSLAGGFAAWAIENIPGGPNADRSFTGNADFDASSNGFEYGVNTNPARADPDHPNNPQVSIGQGTEIRFGYRIGAPELTWILRRTTDFEDWTELYRFDGKNEVFGNGVEGFADPKSGQIHVFDFAPGGARAFYQLIVELHK